MNVLHISGAASWGGNEQQLILNINELNKLVSNNVIYGINYSPLYYEAIKNRIKFIPTSNKKINKLSNLKELNKIIKENAVNVIHLHTSDSLTLFYVYSLFYKFKGNVVFSKKGIGITSSFLSKLKYNSKKINAIVCVSEVVKDNFSKILNDNTKKKVKVIYDCVSNIEEIMSVNEMEQFRKEHHIAKTDFILGSIANHTDAKDLFTLFKAISILKNKYNLTNLKLIQIGAFTNLTQEYKQLIKELGLENQIVFTNQIQNAKRYNSLFDVFVVSSKREGGPSSALEAMLLKTPVVSTDVGIMNEIINNNVNGFICQTENPEALAYVLHQYYINNDVLKDLFASHNFEMIQKNFTAPTIAKKIYAIYSRGI